MIFCRSAHRPVLQINCYVLQRESPFLFIFFYCVTLWIFANVYSLGKQKYCFIIFFCTLYKTNGKIILSLSKIYCPYIASFAGLIHSQDYFICFLNWNAAEFFTVLSSSVKKEKKLNKGQVPLYLLPILRRVRIL